MFFLLICGFVYNLVFICFGINRLEYFRFRAMEMTNKAEFKIKKLY